MNNMTIPESILDYIEKHGGSVSLDELTNQYGKYINYIDSIIELVNIEYVTIADDFNCSLTDKAIME